jgi:hypothetical protein
MQSVFGKTFKGHSPSCFKDDLRVHEVGLSHGRRALETQFNHEIGGKLRSREISCEYDREGAKTTGHADERKLN